MLLKKGRFGLAVAVALCMILMVTGCGSEGSDSANGDEELYQIQWYFDASGPQKDVGLVEDEINKYIKDKINATIKINCLDYGTYKNKLSTMMAGGEAFDLSFANGSFFNANVPKGSYLELDELFDQYMPETKKILGEETLDGVRINGKIYAVPANKDRVHNFGFVYQKEIAEKYNLDMASIKNFDDLVEICKFVKEKEPDITPLGMGDGQSPILLLDFDKIDSLGAFYPDKEPGRVVNMFETPEYYEMLKKIRGAYQDGLIFKDAAVAKNFTAMQKEKAIFAYTQQLKPGKVDEINATLNPPVWEAVNITPPRMMRNDIQGSLTTISRTSKRPDKAAQFLELMYTDKYVNNLVNFGIEGKHYTKTSDNYIDVVEDSGYSYVGLQWKFGNMFLNYLLPNEQPDKFEKLAEYNQSGEPMPTLGFSFDAEPVKIESSACLNVIDEFRVLLESGATDPDVELPKFIEKLKQAGSDRVIAEMQSQYDKWQAEKDS